MVVVRLYGGLGNQMFQYAAARRLSQVNKVPLRMDCSWFALQEQRKYELGIFNVEESFVSGFQSGFIRKINRSNSILRRAASIFSAPFTLQEEKYYEFDQDIMSLKGRIYLDGYWQSEKYFKDVESVIRRDFSFKHPLEGENRVMASEIQASNSVCVHVRRGDYVDNALSSKIHGTCPIEYYQESASRLEKNIQRPDYYVFSDDIDWAKGNLQFLNNARYVDHNDPDHGYEDMRLMSLCKHHIVANSSFSWWGAWLCSNPGQMVFAPAIWFSAGHCDTSDLIPDTWTIV